MQFTLAFVSALMAVGHAFPQASPAPNATDVFVTEVVTALTTFCPTPTQITQGGKTYTITAATTLTITDCPCTVVKPQPTGVAPGPFHNGTVPAPPQGTAPAAPGNPVAPVPIVSAVPVAPAGPGAAGPTGAAPKGNGTAPASPTNSIVVAGASQAGVAVAAVVAAGLAMVV